MAEAQGVTSNEAVWKNEDTVRRWAGEAAAREARRQEQLQIMAALLPFETDDEFTFVDFGSGTGVAARTVMSLYPNSKAIMADFSTAMMGEAEKVLTPFAGRWQYLEFDMAKGVWGDHMPKSIESAVTSLCIHHLPDDRKLGLFTEIFERLKPGGWLLNVDPVTGNPVQEAAWQKVNDRYDPEAAHRRENRNEAQQQQYENHIRYMIPLEQLLGYVREAGFEAVDVYWKRMEVCVYGGRKPL